MNISQEQRETKNHSNVQNQIKSNSNTLKDNYQQQIIP